MAIREKPSLLQAFRAPVGRRRITLTCRRVFYVCSFLGTPDVARVVIRYTPTEWCVETDSLLRFLMSFSRVRVTTEEIGERIRFALQQLLAPHELEVSVTYYPRGGIKVEVENV